MKTILTLIGKDFRVFRKDRIAVVMTLVIPMVMMTIFGMIFGGFGDSGPSGIRVMIIDEANSEASKALIEALKREDGLRISTDYTTGTGETAQKVALTEKVARERLATNADTWRFALIFPENFEREDFGFRLGYLYNPRSEVEFQMVTGLLQKTFFSHAIPITQQKMTSAVATQFGGKRVAQFQDGIARLVSENFDVSYEEVRKSFSADSIFPHLGSPDDGTEQVGVDGKPEVGNPLSFLLELNDEQIAGKNKPTAAQTVGSWAVMFLLFTMTGAASALFEERDHGVFHRLLSGPVSRAHILWSKYTFLCLLGIFQLGILFAFGQAVFGVITSSGQLVPLAVICIAGALASTGFGMVLCAFCKSSAQANGLGTFFILSMSAVGGAMVPSFLFPAFMRDYISPLSMVHWMIDGVLKVLWEDARVLDLWPNLAVLGGVAVITLSIASIQFRRGDLFR